MMIKSNIECKATFKEVKKKIIIKYTQCRNINKQETQNHSSQNPFSKNTAQTQN